MKKEVQGHLRVGPAPRLGRLHKIQYNALCIALYFTHKLAGLRMRKMQGVVLCSKLLFGLSISFNALACTPDGWSSFSQIPGNGETDSPPPVGNIARVSGLCAYAVTDTSYVQSDHASHTIYGARFYVLLEVNGSGTVDFLVAYADESGTNDLFKISYDGTDFIFNASGAGGGNAAVAAFSGWNIIEFEYDAEINTFYYWVNETWDFDALKYLALTGSFMSGSGTVEAVRLGAPNGMGGQIGTITFDAFESQGVILAEPGGNPSIFSDGYE